MLHDSLLIRHGRVRDVDGHIERLSRASGWALSRVRAVYRALLRRPELAAGLWFPKISIDQQVCAVQIRPIAEATLRTEVRLWTPQFFDPRLQPALKGPDFPVQMSLRTQAQANGADEAVLVGADGTLREGAFSSIVHWSEGCLVLSRSEQRLPSVTEAALAQIAGLRGDTVVRRLCTPAEVRAADEVWVLSSLHGIRVVSTWDGLRVASIGRANEYRAALRGREQHLVEWLDTVTTDGCGAAEDGVRWVAAHVKTMPSRSTSTTSTQEHT
ncbi:aminotransferase class IV [Pseudoclavibacter sp. 13-3]|uniref:aminotransferase class IV n=1 Tax=Pseudoclavibacter sp. 13-3 TaxID=2901228 RepID=UPI001E51BF83|nr:aminotransferase class IV [Pseudoclavibacter sp. 13-3]MCD7100785.1 aminotransferase class IV [Pseudoclavibacter sp. 13-3]